MQPLMASFCLPRPRHRHLPATVSVELLAAATAHTFSTHDVIRNAIIPAFTSHLFTSQLARFSIRRSLQTCGIFKIKQEVGPYSSGSLSREKVNAGRVETLVPPSQLLW